MLLPGIVYEWDHSGANCVCMQLAHDYGASSELSSNPFITPIKVPI